MAKDTGLWRLIYEEMFVTPSTSLYYWPEQEKSEYDIGMRSVFQCRKCGFKKSFIHRKGREPNRDHYFCPGCGEAVMVKEKETEQTEPQKSCSTCGYSPQTPSCDSCEGYSNWWPFFKTERSE